MRASGNIVNVYAIRLDGKLMSVETTRSVAEKAFEMMCTTVETRLSGGVERLPVPVYPPDATDIIINVVKLHIGEERRHAQLEQHTVELSVVI